MFFLVLLHIFALAIGWGVSTLIGPPSRVLRWNIVFAAACGQFILLVQILSLFHQLNSWMLMLTNAVMALALAGFAIRKIRKTNSSRTNRKSPFSFREAIKEFGGMNAIVGGFVIIAIAVTALAGYFLFPATDPYHLNMCLFWRQNASIQAFEVHDPRVVSVVFASEVLALPWLLYAGNLYGFIATSLVATLLIGWLVYSLAVGIGGSRRSSLFVSLLFSSSTTLLTAIVGAKSDFLLSTLWLLGSLHCLFEARRFPERTLALLGSSAFLFAMACGAKNTIVLHLPAYGVALLVMLGRSLFRMKTLAHMTIFGLIGVIASGVAWSYAQNQLWFGNWRGHWFLRETLAPDCSLIAVWTRLTRGFVSVVLDCGWLPGSFQPLYARVATTCVQALGGVPTLPEDRAYYSFDPALIKVGSGLGIIGPFVVIPSLAMAGFLCIRNRSSRSDEADRFRALTLFAIISYLVFFAMLRTQSIGVARLMASCVAAGIPLSIVLLRARVGYWIALCAAGFSLLLNSVHATGYALNRVGPDIFPAFTKLKRTRPLPISVRWNNERPMQMDIREPYTNREVYSMISDRIQRADVVGLIGEFNAWGFFCFGPDFSNRVEPLKDCRSETIKKASSDIDCIVIEGVDLRSIEPRILEGFQRVFEASNNETLILAYYERAPAASSALPKHPQRSANHPANN